uniref:Uncharacterized protein n=1 Tax=Phytophthora ramorum TaxID=164328 RepID=H3H5D1_PHYRM
MADGRTRIKITLAGSLVYYFDAWVGPPTGGQDLILGMDFMVPAGIRLDLADGSINLPDEVRIQLAGRRQLYGEKVTQVKLGEHCQLEVGESIEIRKGFILSSHRKLWVTRGDRWVPSLVTGLGKTRYLKITNISDQKLVLQDDTHVGMWLEGGRVPRTPGFVLLGSRRYAEWQNLAFQSTTDRVEVEEHELAPTGPMVDRPQYDTPMKILCRDRGTSRSVVAQLTVPRPAEMKPETEGSPRDQEGGTGDQNARESPPMEQATRNEMTADQKESMTQAETPPIVDPEPLDDEEVCYHEGGDLFAEDGE